MSCHTFHRIGSASTTLGGYLFVILGLALSLPAGAASFTAFNDHVPGLGTGSNVTTYGPGQTGLLKDWSSGSTLAVQVAVTSSITLSNTIEGRPFYGTPASVVFDGIVDLAGYPFPAL